METAGPADELRRWAEGWKVAGEFLEAVKRHDPAQMENAVAHHPIRLLSSEERPWSDGPPFWGRIEQQRLVKKHAPR